MGKSTLPFFLSLALLYYMRFSLTDMLLSEPDHDRVSSYIYSQLRFTCLQLDGEGNFISSPDPIRRHGQPGLDRILHYLSLLVRISRQLGSI